MRNNNLHYYDYRVAQVVGVNAAVIYNYFLFLSQNGDKIINITYEQICKRFNEFSLQNVRTSIDKLMFKNYIEKIPSKNLLIRIISPVEIDNDNSFVRDNKTSNFVDIDDIINAGLALSQTKL